jgi:hypothetical protein
MILKREHADLLIQILDRSMADVLQ